MVDRTLGGSLEPADVNGDMEGLDAMELYELESWIETYEWKCAHACMHAFSKHSADLISACLQHTYSMHAAYV